MRGSSVSLSPLHPAHISLFLCQEFSPRFKVLFSLSTTPLTLDFRSNPPLSFLFGIFYISLRNSSFPVLFSILPPLPLQFSFWFLSPSSLLFLVLLFVPNSCIFWWFSTIYFSYVFLLSFSILFSTSLFPVSILLRYRSLLLAILDFMLLIPISPLIAACAATFGVFQDSSHCSVLCYL